MQDSDPYRSHAAVVEVPQTVTQGRPLASRGARLLAAVVDTVIFMLAGVPLAISAMRDPHGFIFDDQLSGSTRSGMLVSCALGLAVMIAQIVLLHQNRWSIGKRLLRIRIVRSDYSEISLARLLGLRILIPSVIGAVCGASLYGLPLLPIVDACFIFGARRRCLHDYLADTIVTPA